MKLRSYISIAVLFAQMSGPAMADSKIPVTLENNNYRPIGAGFDNRRSEFRGDCVEVTNIEKPERHLPAGSLSLKLEASQESLATKMGMAAGGKYRTGVTTYSASAEFLNEARSNGYSISYNYVSEDNFEEYAENSSRHPIKPRPGIEDYLKDARPFFSNCGNEYVFSRVLSARLFVSMKITFVSKYEKQRFAATFGVDSPVFNMNANLEQASESFSSSNTISIRVEQQGGDPAKKGRVLCPTLEGGKVDPECARSARNVVNCAFGNMKPCMDVIANVIAYSSAQDGENFPVQIADGKNYAVSMLSTRPFVYIGASFPPEPKKSTEDTFQAEVTQLSSIFEEEYEKWTYSHQLAFGKVPRLSERQREKMNVLESTFLKNLARISTGIENCFRYGYTKCHGEVDDVRKDVAYTDPNRPAMKHIEELTKPEVFIQWCDLADVEHPDLQTTIQTLKNHLLQKKILDEAEIKKGDFCAKMDDRLKSVRELDLSDDTLIVKDLRPIGALTQLEVLKLPRKRITSAAPLKDLKNLRVLDLSENFIVDLAPLAKLEALESLKISNNKVTTLETLKGMPALVEIDARGNASALKCPLADPTGCKLLDLSKSTTVALLEKRCTMRVGSSAVDIGGGRVLISGGYAADGSSLYRASMEIQTRDKCTLLGTNLITGRAGHSSTVLKDGRILIAGGFNNSMEIFNPADNTTAPVPVGFRIRRTGHSAVALPDGRVIFIGGHSSIVELARPAATAISEVEAFDPATMTMESWGTLAIPRMDFTATLLNDNRILVLGGYQNREMINLAEVIDPKFKTIQMLDSALNTGRSGHSAVALNDGRVLIAGGFIWKHTEKDDLVIGVESLEIFDPKLESFTPIKDVMAAGRGKMASVLLPDGRVLFAGGDNADAMFDVLNVAATSVQSRIEIFDPASEGVYQAGRLSFPRHQFALAPVSKRSWLVIGGFGAQESLQSSDLIVYR